MTRSVGPTSAWEGYDAEYVRRFYERVGPWLRRVFRLQVSGLEHLCSDEPGILVANHNAGLWGILDVASIYYAVHHLAPKPLGELMAMSEETVFKIPGLGDIAARTGLKVPSVRCLDDCLDQHCWVLVTPGANTDQLRSIWLRRRPRFQRAIFLNGRRIFRDQTWYIDSALRRNLPLYPVSVSGTHEMTPILWESSRLYRWSGLAKWRGDEHWPGFPITLNHVLHAGLLALSPLGASPVAWAIFVLLHVYVDVLYSYPLFPFQIKVHFGSPIRAGDYLEASSVAERQRIRRRVHQELVESVREGLRRLDEDRLWYRAARALRLVG